MKKLINLFKNKTVLAIDPATHSLAFGVTEYNDGNVSLLGAGKVILTGCKTYDEKFSRINAIVPLLKDTFNPDILVIEQPIYIQNFQTSRDISYIVGYTWGRFAQAGINGIDIGPMQWKSALGYKKVSAQEKQEWAKTMLAKDVKKKAEFERKDRIKQIISDNFSLVDDIDDYDIIDAIAISYWGAKYA